jgi:hypothetical protein
MLTKITKENLLFLSSLGQFKSKTAQKIIEWFQKTIVILDSNTQGLLNYTAELIQSNIYYKKRITDIIGKADLSFSSVEPEVIEVPTKSNFEPGLIAALNSQDRKSYRLKTYHTKYSNQKLSGYIFFDLTENESLGSQKFVMLLGPLLKALREASIIWIDELDARIHTNLLQFILKFFNSHNNNPHGSQIVYSSHNVTLLDKDLRRDQIIFVRRDINDGSSVTSLHDWSAKVRSDASFDKDYLKGKYGGIPKIDLSADLFD